MPDDLDAIRAAIEQRFAREIDALPASVDFVDAMFHGWTG
jgi:hypothetical protein